MKSSAAVGRTGYWYAWQKYGIKPDIMTTAKALGCGVPVGAFLMTEKVGQHSLTAGDHGTTYGGNPLACAAVAKVLELFEENKHPGACAGGVSLSGRKAGQPGSKI